MRLLEHIKSGESNPNMELKKIEKYIDCYMRDEEIEKKNGYLVASLKMNSIFHTQIKR